MQALVDRRDDLQDLGKGNRIAFWAGVALTVFSVAMLFLTWTGDLTAFIGLPATALGVLGTFRQFFADRKQLRALRQRTLDRFNTLKVIDYATYSLVRLTDRIVLPEAYLKSGYRIEYLHHGFGAWSPEVSSWLISGRANSTKYTHDTSQYDGPPAVRDSIAPFIEFSRTASARRFSNDRKIRMRTDLVRDESGNFPQVVQFQRTNYLATLATNDLSFKEVINRHSRECQYDGLSGFLQAEGADLVFRGLEQSDCANQIGVSTLAFTSDHYLILVDQTQQNLQSAGLVAPSGSGSLDEDDLHDAGCEGSLVDWLTSASKRELLEELGIACADEFTAEVNTLIDAVTVRAMPLGFCVYLFRGGKPEFFFISRLSCSADELDKISQYTAEESDLSGRFAKSEAYRLKPTGSRATEDLLRICNRLRSSETHRLSFPLELQLALLEHACAEHGPKLDEFFAAEIA